MGENDTARFGLDSELYELFAIGMAAEFEAFHASFYIGFNVRGLEEERIARGGSEEFSTWGFGVAVTDEANRVAGIT